MTISNRHRPADRRAHETIAIEHENQRYKIGLGRELLPGRKLGPIVEVFLNAQKVNSAVDALASDGGILMSLLIQHGCPVDVIRHAMKRNPDGSPASPLGLAAAYLEESDPC